MGEATIRELSARIEEALSSLAISYEIILIDDHSPDQSWAVIQELCAANGNIKGIRLSRNFGQHQAIAAGLSSASGSWAVVMDCDLQDRPEDIPALYAKAMEGYHIVQASRGRSHGPAAKRILSRAYHAIFDSLTGSQAGHTVGNFGIYSRQVIDEYNRMGEYSKQLMAQIDHLGFSRATIPASRDPRPGGGTSYTMGKLTSLAISSITANSNKPLRWAVNLGLVMSLISFMLAIYNIIAKLSGIITVPGYTTTVFSIWFVGGLILLMLGIIGLYIGQILDQVKGRQPYIIMDKINF